MKELTQFLGKPVAYWYELDSFVNADCLGDLLLENTKLKEEVALLKDRLDLINNKKFISISEKELEYFDVTYICSTCGYEYGTPEEYNGVNSCPKCNGIWYRVRKR